jgi:ribA/ribD-fused uncharacterized protein
LFLLAVGDAPRILQFRAVLDRSRRGALADRRALLPGEKFADDELRQKIRQAAKPIIAKSLADTYRAAIRPDWDAVKDEVMYRAVKRKFELHPELREMLLATGQEDIAETAPNDYYWGVGREGTGQNRLGKIIARIRAELRGA